MSKKLVVIGIDALDSDTLEKLKDELPNFRQLLENSKDINFDGVFPPDSPTSWGSIYTGVNPAKHGIVLFVDPLQRVSTMINKDVDDSTIRNKTFWDIVSETGKKVCIMPHLLGYPVWPVNGIMIGRSGVTPDVQIFPENLIEKIDFSQFKWDLKLFPGRNKRKFIETAKKQIERELNFALKIFNYDSWDLFFISFGELDVIQYSFWNYFDENDPTYPKRYNPYKDVIPDFYKIYDEIIGKFLSTIDDDTIIVVVSDHGIGRRPIQLVNINEILRINGYLTTQNDKSSNNPKSSFKLNFKKICLHLIDRFDLANVAVLGLKLLPRGKEWIVQSNPIDWENSKAYLTDQSGIKNYPYGGIIVKTPYMSQYGNTRNEIINIFSKLQDPKTKEYVFKWIIKREELYEGNFLNNYPDLLFELNENYGAGGEIFTDIFGKSVTHNIAPGCHKQHHATFLISKINDDFVISKEIMNLMDVTPTILDLLDINTNLYKFDGSTIFSR